MVKQAHAQSVRFALTSPRIEWLVIGVVSMQDQEIRLVGARRQSYE
jgi:hypothetical protein